MLCPVLSTPSRTLLTPLIPFPPLTAFALVTAPLLSLSLGASPLTRFSAHTTLVDGLLTSLIRTAIPVGVSDVVLTFNLLVRVPVHVNFILSVEDRELVTLPLIAPRHLLVARFIGIAVLSGTTLTPGPVYVYMVRVPTTAQLGMLEVPIAANSNELELRHAEMFPLDILTIVLLLMSLSIPRAGFGFLTIHGSGSSSTIILSNMVNVLTKRCGE